MFLPKLHCGKLLGPAFHGTPVEKTRRPARQKLPLNCQSVENLRPNASFSRLALRNPVLQRVGLGNRRDHLRCRAFCRDLARMLPQFRKRHTANSIRNQNSESQRRQRRTDQHQHIHCILHLPECSLGFPRAPHRSKLDALSRRSSSFLHYSFVTELRHVDPLFCCRIRYESIDLPEF